MDKLIANDEVFRQIKDYPAYYISNYGRCFNQKTNRFIGSITKQGYVRVALTNETNRESFGVHELVLQAFVGSKPNDKYVADHINHKTSDNHVSNLRWVSQSQNGQNKATYFGTAFEYYDELPGNNDDVIIVDKYNSHVIKDLYFIDSFFYFFNGTKYRRLNFCGAPGYERVCTRDVDNVPFSIYYSKFKKLYKLN